MSDVNLLPFQSRSPNLIAGAAALAKVQATKTMELVAREASQVGTPVLCLFFL